MKRYFGIIVAIIFGVVAIVYGSKRWSEREAESQRALALAELRGDYLERVAWIRLIPDEKDYKLEVDTFLRWYFKQVNDFLNKHGGNRDFDDYAKELEERAAKGKDDRIEDKKKVYEYTRKVFDQMKGGSYSPYWSATSQGVRLDILSAGVEGGQIHMPVVVWGLPREERIDDRKVRKVTTNGSFRFTWRLLDEKDKLLGEIPGEGGPDSRVDWPDRYVPFFPQGVLLGHYDIDKVPANVAKAEIAFTISSRSATGGDIMATYEWKLDVPAEWKLREGETWQGATESIRPEEEIDPSKAPKN